MIPDEEVMLNLTEIISTLAANQKLLQTEYGVKRIGVFGSYARGEQTGQSDIDFIVEFSDSIMDLFETKYQLRQYLSNIFHKPVDLANINAIKPYVLKDITPEIRYA